MSQQKLVFVSGDRRVEQNAPDSLNVPWRAADLPSFLYDGKHTFDLNITHPEGCMCPWSPDVVLANEGD